MSASITALPVSLVGLTQLEEVRVALEHTIDGKTQDFDSLDQRTQAWLHECLQVSSGEQFIAMLEDFAQTAPVIDLELATAPSDEWRETLVAWLRTQISSTVLVRLHVRRNLLAGFRLRTGKHEYDLSLASRLRGTAKVAGVVDGN